MVKLYCVLLLIAFIAVSSFSQPVPPGAVLERLATGLQQPEGPVWIDGVGIVCSEIRADRIVNWTQADSLTTYLYPSDSSNGLTLDLQGRLILTQMAERRVSRRETNGTITPLASTYNGHKFNSPNDVVVKSDGSIFFTDPDFNTPAGQPKEMGFKGVFRVSPYGRVYCLDSTTFGAIGNNTLEPNGICFSPDESKLYINNSPNGRIYVWDVVNDSIIANRRTFHTLSVGGYADGMKVDPDSNVYCTGPRGVWIISPAGVCIDTILLPGTESASNCNWGDADRKTLYITGGGSVANLYRIRLAPPTGIKDHGFVPSNSFELYANYPNPFNPSTIIEFSIPENCKATMKIHNITGQTVATIFDKEVKAGAVNRAIFNGSNLSSGIYFARLEAVGKSRVCKLTLLK